MTTPKHTAATNFYLLALTVPATRRHLLERLLTAAKSFFDIISGNAEQRLVGRCERSGRGDAVEHLELMSFAVEETAGDPFVLANRPDGVLKSLIEAVEASGASARVFVARGEASL